MNRFHANMDHYENSRSLGHWINLGLLLGIEQGDFFMEMATSCLN